MENEKPTNPKDSPTCDADDANQCGCNPDNTVPAAGKPGGLPVIPEEPDNLDRRAEWFKGKAE